uniref:Uncharacterized protein n=1 Tax=Parastrongyloides trichosuri TaxID=131310 RepID=A0A0N4ZT65_PARTI
MNIANRNKKVSSSNRIVIPLKKGNSTGGLKDVSRMNINDASYEAGDGDYLAKDFGKLTIDKHLDLHNNEKNFPEYYKKSVKDAAEEELLSPVYDEIIVDENDLIDLPNPIVKQRMDKPIDDNENNYRSIRIYYDIFYKNLAFAINEHANSKDSLKHCDEEADTFDADSGRGSSLDIQEYEYVELDEDKKNKFDIEIEL